MHPVGVNIFPPHLLWSAGTRRAPLFDLADFIPKPLLKLPGCSYIDAAVALISDSPTSQVGHRKILTLGTTRKEVVYLRSAPEVRLVLLLGDLYEYEGHQWQKILRPSVANDPTAVPFVPKNNRPAGRG